MNVTNLKSDIDFLCGSTSATYSDTNKIRNVNIAYQDVARLIWESAGGWQYDDSNATTLPISRATLVHTQQDYSLPTTAQRIERVEVLDKNSNWVKLTELNISDVPVAMLEHLSTAGTPLHYDLVGRSLMLYPAPSSANVTLVSGLKVYMNRDVTEFATTATTVEPGFATAFHRILSYAAAMDFVQDAGQRNFLILQKDRLEKGLTRFYSRREVERPTSIRPAARKNWGQYL